VRGWGLFLAICVLTSCSTQDVDERQIAGHVVARSPVLSRDGASLAFAAAAEGETNTQIWFGRADGSAPARPLTHDSSQNYDPEFSSDGSALYFSSTRERPGIYRIPTSGGAAELVVPNAVAAKISPDGKTILYGLAGTVLERTLAGGTATPVLPAAGNSRAPLWSPDGSRILVTAGGSDPEWWVAPATAGEPRKTSLGTDLRAQGFNSIATNAWLPGDWIVFTGRQGETQTLWKIQLRPDGKANGQAIRATEDAQGDSGASFASGKLVFARTQVGMNLWALRLDPAGEHVTAKPEPLTSDPGRKGQQSAAGAKLLYSAENGDRFSLFLKRGTSTKNLRDAFFAVLAPDATHYVYGEGTKERLTVRQASLNWWSFWSSTLCENCGMPRQFSPDGNKLLLWSDSPPQQHLDLLDVVTHQVNRIIWAAEDIKDPHFSPDGRWLSFIARTGTNQWQAFVASATQQTPLGSNDWIAVTPASDSFFLAFWSARNDLIYTLSSHGHGGNLRFLDAQKLDPVSKRPTGPATPVYEFDETLVPGMDPVWNSISVEDGKIILELGGISAGIWTKDIWTK
jgi:Tol biopolymer transport system component